MQDLKGLCDWLEAEKGITKIDMMDLISHVPEYELWKTRN